ncbi:MAG: V-type ATPase subunit [Bacteroides sp.]|nr:V-type ATPase subunit [Bacillota bacterium]MCM1394397.1 V-type ATPase subunit [[Eubacterium] siraeum]MCM1455553.1 V-type ATPase subunit [Bacteroides sp.]
MSDKFVYQNARVKSMETSLFSSQSVGRLLDCTSAEAAFKALADMGFGSGASVADGDFDALFCVEETRAAEFLKEFNVDGALDAFLAEYDFLNLKSAFKSSVTGKPAVKAPSGKYEFDEVKSWVEQDGKHDVPAHFSNAVAELKKLATTDSVSPHKVDCIADKALYEYVFSTFKKSEKIQRKYFTVKADAANINAFLRCKRLGLSKAYFAEGFIEGGELDFLPSIYEQSLDALKEKCRRTYYGDWVNKAVDENNLVAFEVTVDNALLKMWKDEKDDLFGVAPIVAYYLTKVTQIRVAKLAVAGIKNGVDQAKIKERIRELYA